MSVTLRARDKRFATSVQRLANASLSAHRQHSVTDRDASKPVSSLILSGVHALGATALTLKASDSGPLRGSVPEGLVLTIDGGSYTVQAAATASANALAVTVSPGLAAEQPDATAVTLAAKVSYTYASVLVRPVTEAEAAMASSSGRDVAYKVLVPGTLATTWLVPGDQIDVTMTNGAPVALQRVARADAVSWGQKVFG